MKNNDQDLSKLMELVTLTANKKMQPLRKLKTERAVIAGKIEAIQEDRKWVTQELLNNNVVSNNNLELWQKWSDRQEAHLSKKLSLIETNVLHHNLPLKADLKKQQALYILLIAARKHHLDRMSRQKLQDLNRLTILSKSQKD